MQPAHEGMRARPSSKEVMRNLQDRGLLSLLQEVATRWHCTAEEVAGPSVVTPMPTARADLWSRLREPPYSWSYTRISQICGVDTSTVITSVKNYRKRQQKVGAP